MAKTLQVYGFPSTISAEEIKQFLEQYIGPTAIYAIEVGQPRIGHQRTYAKVQFTTNEDAKLIISLADNNDLWFGDSYLKARENDVDLIPKPRVFLHEMDNITLHFGCLLSREKFFVLWTKSNVSVKFGFNLRKLYFFFSHNDADYKLELSYENIWQIEQHCLDFQSSNFLVIQLSGAPRIYRKVSSPTSYYIEAANEQWIRETDFTENNCIGQSSAICLKLPYGNQLPDFDQYMAYYKKYTGQYVLETGSPYSSSSSNLAPIVYPPHMIKLPYQILFKVNSLVQHGVLTGPSLDVKFFRLVDPKRMYMPIERIEHALEKMSRLHDCCYEPTQWLLEEYKRNLVLGKFPSPASFSLDDGLVYVHKVQVTPSKVYFCGPEINVSNRVLRNFVGDLDNFLRVSFVDEELEKLFSTDLSPRAGSETRSGIYWRILSTLRDGIVIGDKKFEFLAFSSSQLRENSVWMFASREGLTAADIREWMGDFRQIRNVAKYATRLGQSFGSSTETLTVENHEVELIPDITIVTDGVKYVFSDGIGKISSDFAKSVAMKCGIIDSHPSAFQIRYGGFKGVVAVDPTSSMKLYLRKSMLKYESSNKKLDVLAWTKYQPCFLNRQVIILLSTLGIKDHVFERMQREGIAQLNAVLSDRLVARQALELMAPGENSQILKEMLLCGYEPDSEPFLSMMLRTFCASRLLELRTKSRIFVPNGRSMMGCLDETRILEYGQVFVQISCIQGMPTDGNSKLKFRSTGSNHDRHVLQGKILVAKNPCFHPGDIRILMAIDVPALHHMIDCVVFPQQGKRPHPNECSGSDLDGDIYFISWDHDLIPPCQTFAMDYTPAPTMTLDHDVTIEEVMEYFAEYMVNDSLGIIANAHVAFADQEPEKARSKRCIELAKLFSIAVDFPKTGVTAEIPPELRVKEYPDFMEKPNKKMYESQRVIGKLFREIRNIAPPTSSMNSFTKEVARDTYDADMEVTGFKDYIDEALDYKILYDNKLRNLMYYYEIKTEAEILSGNVLTRSKSYDKKRDMDNMKAAVRSLRKQAKTWFIGLNCSSNSSNNAEAIASAWYHVTYHPDYWGRGNQMHEDHLLSFPWCVYDKLVEIKKQKTILRRAREESSLREGMNRQLRISDGSFCFHL